MTHLVGALKAVPELETLNLCGSSLGHAGAVALGGGLKCLHKLKVLDLSFCNIDCVFGRWGEANRSLDGGVHLAAGMSSLSKLEVLVLRDSARAANTAQAVVSVLGNLRMLRRLDMHGWPLEVVHAEVAQSLTFCGRDSGGLQQLDLSSTGLSCQDLAFVMPAVAAHSHLTELDLDTPLSKNGVPKGGLTNICKHLGGLTCLQKLTLGWDEPGELQATMLASALTCLTCISDLSLTVNINYDEEKIAHILLGALDSMSGLQRLKLGGLEFADSQVLYAAFNSLGNLKFVSVEHCSMVEVASRKVVQAVQAHTGLLVCIVPQRYSAGNSGYHEYSVENWPEWVVLGRSNRE